MRSIVSSLLLLACLPLIAIAAPPGAPLSAANIVRWHPAPWRMPAPVRLGLRFDPGNGEATVVEGPGDAGLRTANQAEARARAAATVQRSADGSGHAYLGSAFRSWAIVTIEEDGRLTQDCVSSQAEAQARVEAAARKQVRK